MDEARGAERRRRDGSAAAGRAARAGDDGLTAAAARRTRAGGDGLWAQLDALGERWDVRRHAFYRRWAAGGLGPGELALYAEEHDHAVVALATAARRAAAGADGLLGEQLARHAEEARAHVELWRRFAHGVGWGCGSAWHYGEDPLAETVACARAWAGNPDRSLAAHLVTLYAVESVQPRVAQLALDGLRAHYGVADGPATAWFRARIAAGGDRAGLVRAGLAGLLRGGDDDAADALLRQAEAAHRAHWELLDGLERVAGSPYQAVQPPSTRSTEPVTLPEASQAR